MESIQRNHALGRREGSCKQRATSMAVHRGLHSRRDSGTLGRLEPCCESTFSRNTAGVTANSVATPFHLPNCRHICHSSINFRSSCHFHDRFSVHDEHTESARRAAKFGQTSSQRRTATQSSCDCGHGQGRDLCEESELQVSEENVLYRRGASVPDTQAGTGPSHADEGCGCCHLSGSNTNLGRNDGGDVFDDRIRALGGTPCFSVSDDFTYRATANAFMSKPSSVSRKGSPDLSRIESIHRALAATKASVKQVILYGWFLKRPSSGNGSTSCSTVPQVVIGGYKSAGMLESDYFESGPIVQRLERWRLQTSDGLEVGLMGMINVSKSVANGFPEALVQCFMIGFPSAWIYMISNFGMGAPSGDNTDLPSSSAVPSNATGQAQDPRNYRREVPLNTATLEADPVRIILSSSLFIAPEEAGMITLRRLSSSNNVHLQGGVESDATSVSQSVHPQEGLDRTRNDNDSCYGAINTGNHSGSHDPMASRLVERRVTQVVLPEGGEEHSVRLGDDNRTRNGSDSCYGAINTGNHSAGHDPRPSRFVERRVTQLVVEEGGEMGDGLEDTVSSPIPKEELGVEGGVPERTLNEEARPNIDWGEFLGDGNSRDQQYEARVKLCDEANATREGLVNVGVVGAVDTECTCGGVSYLKLTCPSCGTGIGLDVTKFSEGVSQDGERKADLNVKESSNEFPSRGNEAAKGWPELLEDSSDFTRKRPFQGPVPEEEEQRHSKMLCETLELRLSATSTIGNDASGSDSGQPIAVGTEAGLMQDSIPCTPLQESKKRSRNSTETPGANEETIVMCNVLSHAGPAALPSQSRINAAVSEILCNDLDRESGDTGVEPCEEEIIVSSKESVVDESKTRKSRKKSVGAAVRSPSPFLVDTDPGFPRDDGVVATEFFSSNSQMTSFVSLRRSRRRSVTRSSPRSQSGKESNGVLVVACSDVGGKESNHVLKSDPESNEGADVEYLYKEIEESRAVPVVACWNEAGTESNHALKSDRKLENTDEENGCKEIKQVVTPGNNKRSRKSRKYYKGRRKKSTKRVGFIEKDASMNHHSGGFRPEESKGNLHKDSLGTSACGEKHIEEETDYCLQAPRGETPAPIRQKHQRRSSRKNYRVRRKYHDREGDLQTSGDGLGDAADGGSNQGLEDSDKAAKSMKCLRNTAERSFSGSRRASPKALNRVIQKGQPQRRKNKTNASIVPPPPPAPRVVDKTKVPEAFGLKKSRHGRVLVPRLATWRNQSIKYDMDGSIIAIAEGFEGAEGESGTGCYNFKPPSDKEARTMQRKLQKAAELVRT